MSDRLARIREALEGLTGGAVGELRVVRRRGGSINEACVVEAAGERFFAKWNDRPLARQFEVEARGLEALATAGSSLVIPRPLAFSDEGPGRSFLLLEHLEAGRRVADLDERLGRGLAELHRATSARGHGFSLDGYCGATPQPNAWDPSWTRFYAEQRLGHQLRLARADGFTREEARVVERVIERLPTLVDDEEPPALLHGDLWSGNLHVDARGLPALIDPAAYYGHREAELGMMLLFGGFGPRVLDAYEEVRPLASGWRERVGLYSLYHLLNHHHLFGGGYRAQALDVARRYA